MRLLFMLKIMAPVLLSGLVGCAATGPDPVSRPVSEYTTEGALVVAGKALAEERYRDAAGWFQKVLANERDHEAARIGLAEAYLGMGEYKQSLDTFDLASASETADPRISQGRGIALLALGEADKAHDALTEAVRSDSSSWRAWNALGLYYDARDRWDKAEDAYRKACEAAPHEAVPQNNWGMSLMAQSRYEDAARKFARAVELAPASETAENNLRLALAHQGNYAEAMVGVAKEDQPRTLNNLGYVAMLRGETGRARAYFLRAIDESPTFYEPASRNLSLLEGMEKVKLGD